MSTDRPGPPTYANHLKETFPDLSLVPEDLMLLEPFQIESLPNRVPFPEFAALLHANPKVQRCLETKCPPITSFVRGLLRVHRSTARGASLRRACQHALWSVADLIVYNKHPEMYDTNVSIRWSLEEITSVTSLAGRVVADVGAGSGRIALLIAAEAKTVFAVEPQASFRALVKAKADNKGIRNVCAIDGTLSSIPLPEDSLDVLLTSNAIGWNLEEELAEIERVVKPGGCALHLIHALEVGHDPLQGRITIAPWNYRAIREEWGNAVKTRYYRVFGEPEE